MRRIQSGGEPKKKENNEIRKSRRSTLIWVVILLVGIGLLVYPTFSDWWNTMHQARIVSTYSETVANLSSEEMEEMYEEAVAYNEKLAENQHYLLTDEEMEEYNNTLAVAGGSVMAYITIPKINVTLPIYHGTDEDVLQVAIGHLPGSSLPVGGESTHCVISGHRGLPSARLFTDIDQLVEGDRFTISVLDRTLTYEVDQIRTVLPEELDDVMIEEGKDYCTLVTCTPYGVNTHRLLVRGHRVENEADEIRVTADALQIDTNLVALAIGLLLVIWILLFFIGPGRKMQKENNKIKQNGQEGGNHDAETDTST